MSSYQVATTNITDKTNTLAEYGDVEATEANINKLANLELSGSTISIEQNDQGAVRAAFDFVKDFARLSAENFNKTTSGVRATAERAINLANDVQENAIQAGIEASRSESENLSKDVIKGVTVVAAVVALIVLVKR